MSQGELHLFQMGDKKIVFDVESDSLYVVDGLAWNVINLLDQGYSRERLYSLLADQYSREDIGEVLQEIEELKSAGHLWSPPPHLENTPAEPVVKALCLNAAHICNLTCRYCFAGKGEYGGGKPLMSYQVGKSAVDFLLEQSGGRRHVEIDFFGGEPLLNLENVKKITEYAREKGKEKGTEVRFTLTTNGLLLNDEVREYLARENFSVILSLDGRPEVHNRMRTFPDGSFSYPRVIKRLSNFVNSWEGSYYVRGTYTRFNRDFFNDVYHLYQEGFRHISLEPVVSEPHQDWALQEEDLDELAGQYRKLAEFYLECCWAGDPFTFFHFEIDLEEGPCLFKRLSGCGAGSEYLAVTPDGDIYPCHQLVGMKEYVMGNVLAPERVKHILPEEKFPAVGPTLDSCRNCWARYHCGGGCRAASLVVNGDPKIPYNLECALQQKRLECALYIKACLKEE